METTFNIGKKDITYIHDGDAYFLQKLSDINKLGKKCFWEIWVRDNKIYRKSYQSGGKIREFPEISCTGKNIGRSNETTPHEQALFEAHSMWTKKQDQGYVIDQTDQQDQTVDNNINQNQESTQSTQSTFNKLPMLANKYEQRKSHLSLPFGISPKLDGIRVFVSQNEQDIVLSSRMGKPFSFLDNIRNSLRLLLRNHPNIIIDGELYSHDLPFNTISGVVRAKKKKSEHDEQMELWIFDLIDTTNKNTEIMSYQDRMELLKHLEQEYDLIGGQTNLKFVYYDLCDNHNQVAQYHTHYVDKGFEGIMCRNLNGTYLFKNRSNDLLKYKAFEDAEFEIIGAKPGIGTEKGAIVFECTCDAGVFDVRPRGSIDKRREMFRNKHKYIGKSLTVRYQPHTNYADQEADTGIPRFPVGIDVRDYE